MRLSLINFHCTNNFIRADIYLITTLLPPKIPALHKFEITKFSTILQIRSNIGGKNKVVLKRNVMIYSL